MLKRLVSGLALALFAMAANAAAVLKPFILADVTTGDVAAVQAQVEKKLADAGFEVLGSYSPYAGSVVMGITNDALKQNAAKSDFGGYAAAQRVSVTKVGNDVQVSYTNPVYMANAYRMAGDLSGVAAQLEKALGKRKSFGSADGVTVDKLRDYQYTFMMEQFDSTGRHELASYSDHQTALRTVEENLKKGVAGVSKVYRVDIPGKDEVLFGVGMKMPKGGDKYMDDSYIMGIIDFEDTKSTAHLPYDILVSGNKVYHLYARFRIAINFPDLKMMGDNSFMKIMSSPDALKAALGQVAGAEEKSGGFF